MRRAEEEISFYQTKFREIIEEFGEKENGEYTEEAANLFYAYKFK